MFCGKSSIVTVACCVLLVLNIVIFLSQIGVQVSTHIKKKYTYLDGDWPRELELPTPHRTVFMAFNDSEPFMDIYAPDAGANWDANLPPGRGYIKLGHHKELFGVTMFHQMHCLVRLRAVFAGDRDDSGHVEHCFNYLRQAILCNSDITLEPGETQKTIRPNGEIHTHVVGGINTSHKCRDWKQVFDFMADEWKKSFPDKNKNPLAYAEKNGQA